MGKNKAVKYIEKYNSLLVKYQEMIEDMFDKEDNDIHIDEDRYKEIYDVALEYSRHLRVKIEALYNDFVDKRDKIDVLEFIELTEEEEKHLEKVKEKFYYSEYRGYIESRLTKNKKLVGLTKDLRNNNKLHKTYGAVAKCGRKIKFEHSMLAVEASVETVFKKAIIPAFSKGAKLAKSGYYAGMDELGKKADIVYDNFYKEMKAKPTSTLLDYYNNRDLNDNQIAIIEEVLNERGAL